MKIHSRTNIESEDKVLYFINYTIHNQSLLNANPLTKEIQLSPGKYLFGLIIRSENLPKIFHLRITTNDNTIIKKIG